MSYATRLLCGIILLTVPTIQYGGYFLLEVLSGNKSELGLTDFQTSMFRAGHAHAGVLVILSLIAQVLADHAQLSTVWEWIVRIGFPLSAILVSGGFFGGAIGDGVTEPTGLVYILYTGAGVLFVSTVTLGVGLVIRK